jgi:hypothetical protein
MLIAKNSQLGLKNPETKATVKMNVEGMEKLNLHQSTFKMNVGLQNDNERQRKKAETVGWYRRFVQFGGHGVKPVPISWDFKLSVTPFSCF